MKKKAPKKPAARRPAKRPAKAPVKTPAPRPPRPRERDDDADWFSCAFCHTYDQKPFAVCKACGHAQPGPSR